MEAKAILIRPGSQESSQLPLFLVHDGHGLLDYAPELSKQIDMAIPVYGLPAGETGSDEMRTIHGMASRMIRLMRQIQPKGPYRLAGWCFGGVLAFEIATQLLGIDQPVEFLGIFGASYGLNSDHQKFESMVPGNYFAQTLKIPVHLFPAKEEKDADLTHGWKEVGGEAQLRVIPVPGNASSMMQSPNVDTLGQALNAALLDSRGSSRNQVGGYAPLVTLQTGRPGMAPLFCVPGAGASIVSFTELAGCIDRSWPIHGFQPRGLDGFHLPHATMEANAECYLQALLQAHPRGPVHLLGHSFGGWVVLEMAHRLKAAGRDVASLTIIDTEVPGEDPKPHTHADVLDKWLEIFEMMIEKPLGLQVDDLAKQPMAKQLALVHEKLACHGLMPKRSNPELLRGPLNAFASAIRSCCKPVRVYDGPLHLVYVDDSKMDAAGNQKYNQEVVEGWTRWTKDLRSLHGPGNHMTALKLPHIDAIVQWLMESMRK